jgi:hypothetical protein
VESGWYAAASFFEHCVCQLYWLQCLGIRASSCKCWALLFPFDDSNGALLSVASNTTSITSLRTTMQVPGI